MSELWQGEGKMDDSGGPLRMWFQCLVATKMALRRATELSEHPGTSSAELCSSEDSLGRSEKAETGAGPDKRR